MSELQPSTPEQSQRFAVTLSPQTKEAASPELAPLFAWFQKEAAKLPEMKVTKRPLTDGESWKRSLTPDKEIDRITSPFFRVEGIDVTTDQLSWHQGAIVQRSDVLSTKDGKPMEVSGVVVLVTNPEGNTLVTMAQEPLAPSLYRTPDRTLKASWIPQGTEIHPVIKTPIQTSIEKLKKITATEAEGMRYDPTLTTLLRTVAVDKHASVVDVFNDIPFTQSPTDGNRIASNVLYGQIRVSREAAEKINSALPGARWCSPKELDALIRMGVSNGHLNIARSIVAAQRQ